MTPNGTENGSENCLEGGGFSFFWVLRFGFRYRSFSTFPFVVDNPISGSGQTRCRHRQMPYRTLVSHGTRGKSVEGVATGLGWWCGCCCGCILGALCGQVILSVFLPFFFIWVIFFFLYSKGANATCWLPHFSWALCCDNKWLFDGFGCWAVDLHLKCPLIATPAARTVCVVLVLGN